MSKKKKKKKKKKNKDSAATLKRKARAAAKKEDRKPRPRPAPDPKPEPIASPEPAPSPAYSFKLAAMKLCKRGAQVAASYAAAHWLVDVNPEALAVLFYGFAEAGRNALKVKYPGSFGWL